MDKPKIPNGHFPRLPWRIDPRSPSVILDAEGVPVTWASGYTSIQSRERIENADGSFKESVLYNSTDTCAAIRAKIIVEAVNYVHAMENADNG